MAHKEQQDYFCFIKDKFPSFFTNKKVLDVGSCDINGSPKFLFKDCDYIGCDVFSGKNVDVVGFTHELTFPDNSFDVIISSECFEHDPYFNKSILNILRMLKSGGLFTMTCATTGRKEHGTASTSPDDSLTSKLNINHYKNITEQDFRDIINIEEIFSNFEFNVLQFDLRFFGIKK